MPCLSFEEFYEVNLSELLRRRNTQGLLIGVIRDSDLLVRRQGGARGAQDGQLGLRKRRGRGSRGFKVEMDIMHKSHNKTKICFPRQLRSNIFNST